MTQIRLLRVNPLTLDAGQLVVMGARQLGDGKIVQFPMHMEYKLLGDIDWRRVEIVNGFEEKKSEA